MFRDVDTNMPFLIGSPLVGWKCERGEGLSWLRNAQEIKTKFPNAEFFAALEIDATGLEPFSEVISLLDSVGGKWWTYSLNDNDVTVTSENRWIRIEMGRNLIREFAQRRVLMSGDHWGEHTDQSGTTNFEAILYVDSDILLEADHISKLAEVDHPMVGIDVAAYCLRGDVVNDSPRIEEHWNTAGCLWVNSPAFYDLVWQHNSYMNFSDDPATQNAMARLKVYNVDATKQTQSLVTEDRTWGQTWVRKDVGLVHEVALMVPIEERNIPDRNY